MLLPLPDPQGVRTTSMYLIKPTLTPGLNTAVLVLRDSLAEWGFVNAGTNWNTTVYMVDGTQTYKGCTMKFSTVIPTGAEMFVLVVGSG